MWWVAAAWAVPGLPDVRYTFEGLSPVPDVASGSSDLTIAGCALGAPSFHPTFGTALSCPALGAANTAPWSPTLAYGDQFTVAVWTYVPDVDACPGGDTLCTFVAQGNTDGVPYGFMFHTRGRRVRLTVHDGAGESFLSAGTDLPEGRWVHLAARVNGSVVTLFEDGVKQVEADVGLNVAHEVDAPLRVGHTLGRSFDLLGQADEVLLFRRPLGDSEVTALYDWYVDGDGDGFTGDDDCDDADDAIHPGAADPPGDGVDGDCDGTDPPPLDSGGGTGATGVVVHTGSTTVAAHTGASRETAAAHTGTRPVDVVDPGCGCASASAPGWLLALAGGLARRRRVQQPPGAVQVPVVPTTPAAPATPAFPSGQPPGRAPPLAPAPAVPDE